MTALIRSKLLIANPASSPIPGGEILIEDRRISAIGAAGEIDLPADCEVIDCTQYAVMPGLIDSHAHITANNKYPGSVRDHYLLDLATAVLRGSMNLRDDLATGVTTMRTLGDRDGVERSFRDA
ncbi:MAG: hypothetical protein MUQ10_05265, partial [Anaerolineae bacterium]|nr:hypothetical protein [Anaerolineae bacterium]